MERDVRMAGLQWRIVVSIVAGTVWLAFALVYAAFWAAGYNLFQSIVIILVSFLVFAGVTAAMWAGWGMRFAR